MQRMSGLDASFLYIETPTMPMHVGLVCVLEPSAKAPYDYRAVHTQIESEARAQPSFRKRLVEVPLGVSHPYWMDDPNFDAIHHVRRVTCDAPGGQAELCDMVGRIMSSPLDRMRPLWEVWIVEGLELGRYALVCKVHHAIADGMGGAQLLATMFSSSPDVPSRRSASQAPEVEVPSVPPPPIPTELEMLKTALATKVDASRELVRLFRRTTQALGEFYERRTHEDHNSGASVFDAPRTCWNEPMTGDRIAAFARISAEDVRAIRKPFDATAHEVLLAICAGGLRGFLVARGELPSVPLVVACPVATRSRTAGQGSNRISAMLTSLATHIEDPVLRLASVRASSRGARAEHDALGGDMLASWAELVFPGMFKTAAKLYTKYRVAARHRPIYNLVVSNLTGPRKPLYFGGARMVAAYPLGPIVEGAGLNITIMSYGTDIDFGMVAARTLLPDLAEIASHIREATAELLAAAHNAGPSLSAPRGNASSAALNTAGERS